MIRRILNKIFYKEVEYRMAIRQAQQVLAEYEASK